VTAVTSITGGSNLPQLAHHRVLHTEVQACSHAKPLENQAALVSLKYRLVLQAFA
jgi:hypothetical protein